MSSSTSRIPVARRIFRDFTLVSDGCAQGFGEGAREGCDHPRREQKAEGGGVGGPDDGQAEQE